MNDNDLCRDPWNADGFWDNVAFPHVGYLRRQEFVMVNGSGVVTHPWIFILWKEVQYGR